MDNIKDYKTSGRTKILKYLQDNKNKTVTVQDIHAHLEETGNPTNITTVYRYLDKLSKDGFVTKYLADKGNMTTFQYVDDAHKCEEHLHLKCTKCGTIVHLDCDFMDQISEHIAEDHGFDLKCQGSILYGVCARCRNRV